MKRLTEWTTKGWMFQRSVKKERAMTGHLETECLGTGSQASR